MLWISTNSVDYSFLAKSYRDALFFPARVPTKSWYRVGGDGYTIAIRVSTPWYIVINLDPTNEAIQMKAWAYYHRHEGPRRVAPPRVNAIDSSENLWWIDPSSTPKFGTWFRKYSNILKTIFYMCYRYTVMSTLLQVKFQMCAIPISWLVVSVVGFP